MTLPDSSQWVLADLSHMGDEPDDSELGQLLKDCTQAAFNLSNEISRLHFSHADRHNQSLGA